MSKLSNPIDVFLRRAARVWFPGDCLSPRDTINSGLCVLLSDPFYTRDTKTWCFDLLRKFNPLSAKLSYLIFSHLKLCLATATHNFKWVEITHSCLIWEQIFTNLYI